jgi:pimeloyl-ACP methyl ester carboxylesterase
MMTRVPGRRTIEGLFVVLFAASAAAQPAPARVEVGGIELHYIERGEGEPLILLHGGQADYRAWQPQIDALAPRYRVIAYSRRYHFPNRNSLGSNHSPIVDAEDLAEFIRTLKLGPVHLVGTSIGAYTAMAFAMKHPEQIRTMVLAEPPIHPWAAENPRGAALYKSFMENVQAKSASAFRAGNDEAAMRILIDAFDGPGTFDTLPTERKQIVMANVLFFKALSGSNEPFPNLPRASFRAMRMPVLVIHGENTDALHEMDSDEVAKTFPNASRATIPKAGHGSPRQNPDAFNAAMLIFLARHRQGAQR